MLSLISHLGGLNPINPIAICQSEYKASVKLSAPLTEIIIAQSDSMTFDIPDIKSDF